MRFGDQRATTDYAAEAEPPRLREQRQSEFLSAVCELIGTAAMTAFAEFLDNKRYTRNQIEFVTLIIDHLTDHGVLEAARLYEQPFSAVAPRGPEDIFIPADVDRLFELVERTAST
jgi:type I restriction enzyme R subunit